MAGDCGWSVTGGEGLETVTRKTDSDRQWASCQRRIEQSACLVSLILTTRLCGRSQHLILQMKQAFPRGKRLGLSATGMIPGSLGDGVKEKF